MNSKFNHGVTVSNAGLILLNSYIPLLFERLGFTNGNRFINQNTQSDSVLYLQYISTGILDSEEVMNTLNKVLCGLPLEHPIQNNIMITEDQKKLIDGMIKAAIRNWPAINQSSIKAFRENWLIRKGLLTEDNEKWQLIVEKHAYDILLSKSPFSSSVIKFPWMHKPLHVQWAY